MAKKSIGLILGLEGPPKEARKGGGMRSHKRSVAKELISAVRSGDPDGVTEAFQAMYDLCCADEDYEGDDEDDESEDDMEEGLAPGGE